MNRYQIARTVRFFFHWHYDIRLVNKEVLYAHQPILLMPNHTAFVDPLVLFAELHDLPICPMVDERFMRHRVFGRILQKVEAVEVPDLQQSAMSRQEGAAKAEQLSRIAIEALAQGKSMVVYPSGHIKTSDQEIIGNRRLAYEVCRELPANTAVILCRMRGLEQSRWSKLPTKRVWRRQITLQFEDKTAELREWAQQLSRREFNLRLEDWYNSQD